MNFVLTQGVRRCCSCWWPLVAAAGAPSDIRIRSGLALFRLWVRLLVARVKAREGGELPIAPHCLPGQPA
jgi:hypothetical protein